MGRCPTTQQRELKPPASRRTRMPIRDTIAVKRVKDNLRDLNTNTDDSMRALADELGSLVETLPDSDYFIPESTPIEAARKAGRTPDNEVIQQFGSGFVTHSFQDPIDKN